MPAEITGARRFPPPWTRLGAFRRLKVVNFDQTHSTVRDRFCGRNYREGTMTAPKNDQFKDYTRYAEFCLNMVASTGDQELRCIQREMAAEWLRLADVVRRPRRCKQMQMG